MNKRLLNFIMVLCMIISMVSVPVQAEEVETCGHDSWDFHYSVDENYHWKRCITGGCEAITDKASHNYDSYGVCETCSYYNGDFTNWTAWDGTQPFTYTDNVAHIYLNADVDSAKITVDWNKTLYLNLNGHVLKGTDSSIISSTGYLRIYDSISGQPATRYGKWVDGTYVISDTYTEGATELTGGIITGGKSSTDGDSAIKASNSTLTSAIFIMYGGNIAGNSYVNGGGLQLTGNSALHGVNIVDNKASVNGGALLLYYNTNYSALSDTYYSLYSCNINDNTAKNGGGIYSYSSHLNVFDGDINDNVASGNGGAINFSLSSGVQYIHPVLSMNGLTISNNVATGHGGAVYAEASGVKSFLGTIDVYDCDITGNKSNKNGGGIYATNTVNLIVTNGRIVGNQAENGAGISVSADKFVLAGSPEIKDNLTINDEESRDITLINNTKITISTDTPFLPMYPIGVYTDYDNIDISTPSEQDYSGHFVSDRAGDTKIVNKVTADGNVVAVSNYYNVTLAAITQDTHGTYEFNRDWPSTPYTLPPKTGVPMKVTPDDGYYVKNIIVYKTGDPNTTVSSVNIDNRWFSTPSNPAFDVTVEVIFAELPQVNLSTNGGIIAEGKNVTHYVPGEKTVLPDEGDITREGYRFLGWYDNAEFTDEPVTSFTSNGEEAKTFYAKWEEVVATVEFNGTVTYHNTFEDAWAKAKEYNTSESSKATITLLSDCTVNIQLQNTDYMVLDTNGKTLTSNLSGSTSILNNSELYITGNGTITGNSGNQIIQTNGKLVLDGANIVNTATNGKGVSLYDGSTFTMERGSITTNNWYCVHLRSGSFTMKDGSLTSKDSAALAIDSGRTAILYSGTITSNTYALSGGTARISYSENPLVLKGNNSSINSNIVRNNNPAFLMDIAYGSDSEHTTLLQGQNEVNDTVKQAKYVKIQTVKCPQVNVSSNNSNYGSVTGGGGYPVGSTATVTATANNNYYFKNWTVSGQEVSTATTYAFTVTTDCELVANFVEKSNPTYSAPTKKTNLVYNGTSQELLNPGSVTNGTLKYSSDGNTWNDEIPTGSAAGNYVVYYKIIGDEHYKDINPTSINTSIAQRTVEIAWDDQHSFEYDGTEKSIVAPAVTNLAGEDTIALTVTGTTSATNAGTYTATVTNIDNTNYTLEGCSTVTKQWTIAPKTINPVITLTAPVANAVPMTTTEGVGYTANIEWSPAISEKFAYSTTYTAVITITPDSNHTTEGIAANGYSIEGATVTNEADATSMTAVFTNTAAAPSKPRPSENTGTTVPTIIPIDTDAGIKVENCANDDTCPANHFEDTSADAWYHDGLHYVVETGLMQGTEDGFKPFAKTDRATIVTVLYRLAGSPEVKTSGTFSDVDSGKWYSDAIEWAAANGIVLGYGDDAYGPADVVTRQQMATIFYRFAAYMGIDVASDVRLDGYKDTDMISDYAYDAMNWSVDSGLINGTSVDQLSPQADSNRAQIATILMRFCEEIVK